MSAHVFRFFATAIRVENCIVRSPRSHLAYMHTNDALSSVFFKPRSLNHRVSATLRNIPASIVRISFARNRGEPVNERLREIDAKTGIVRVLTRASREEISVEARGPLERKRLSRSIDRPIELAKRGVRKPPALGKSNSDELHTHLLTQREFHLPRRAERL